jgi:DNA-binding MarR family transcriptional regulator
MGASALGARLRRLSERIDREAAALYVEYGVEFEQRWFGVLNQLVLGGPASVGALAEALGVTHAAVSQTRQALEEVGLVRSEADASDTRRRNLAVTQKGRALMTKLRPVFDALAEASRELDAEAGEVLQTLNRLEEALDRRSLVERARRRP